MWRHPLIMTTLQHTLPRARPATATRTVAWICLIAIELIVLKWLLNFQGAEARYANPITYALMSVRWAAAAAAIFAVLIWSERRAFAAAWSSERARHAPLGPLLVNLLLFALMAISSMAITVHATGPASSALIVWIPYAALLAAVAISLLRIDVPLRGLWRIAVIWRTKLAWAVLAGFLATMLAEAALLIWPQLAGATLHLTAGILRLYEPDVVLDVAARTITIGHFTIIVEAGCGGHEGIALITTFLTIYLWVFRSELRFPAAYLLYPLGLATIWLLNSVRIAALTSLGAHVSPQIAVNGFHSQAGWITFLLVSICLMVLARSWAFIHKPVASPSAAAASKPAFHDASPTARYLVPFIALMLGSMIMSATAPHNQPAYILKAAAVALALWALRHSYGNFSLKVSKEAALSGIIVGAVWIATDPAPSSATELARWLASIGPELAAVWLLVRGLGTIVLVPVAEELAFRGYLYRRLLSSNFDKVPLTQLSLMSLIVSSALFGLLHDRWLSGAIAGAVFALVMVRSGRLSDAVASHAIANALIFIWALAFRQWSLI